MLIGSNLLRHLLDAHGLTGLLGPRDFAIQLTVD